MKAGLEHSRYNVNLVVEIRNVYFRNALLVLNFRLVQVSGPKKWLILGVGKQRPVFS